MIPHGVDGEWIATGNRARGRRRLRIDERRHVVLSLGRISPEKAAYQQLLMAFRGVVTTTDGEPPLLVVAGAVSGADIPYLRYLKALAGRVGVAEHVRFLDGLGDDDKPDLLAAADVMVSPAINPQESFGIALLEGLAAGLAVVATDWNGYPEVLPCAYSPRLVPTLASHDVARAVPWNSASEAATPDPLALVGQLRTLRDDPHLRAQLAAEGRTRVPPSGWGVAVERLLEICADITTHPAAGGPRPPLPEGPATVESMVTGLASAYLNDGTRLQLATSDRALVAEARRFASFVVADTARAWFLDAPAEPGAPGAATFRGRRHRPTGPLEAGDLRRRRRFHAIVACCRDAGPAGVTFGELRAGTGMAPATCAWLVLKLVQFSACWTWTGPSPPPRRPTRARPCTRGVAVPYSVALGSVIPPWAANGR